MGVLNRSDLKRKAATMAVKATVAVGFFGALAVLLPVCFVLEQALPRLVNSPHRQP